MHNKGNQVYAWEFITTLNLVVFPQLFRAFETAASIWLY